MATKRTKSEAPAAKAAKPAPKRKVAVGPAVPEARAAKTATVPTMKSMTPPAPKAKLKSTRKPATALAEASVPAHRLELTTEMVALRAYFIGQRRQESGLPGDSTTDWLEAEKELRGESVS